ncbi:hypothetical protein PI124_g8684 [Phytophthora idaei]|nr:hypothetical protein PI124_g8684 [Phytophthora idaei]
MIHPGPKSLSVSPVKKTEKTSRLPVAPSTLVTLPVRPGADRVVSCVEVASVSFVSSSSSTGASLVGDRASCSNSSSASSSQSPVSLSAALSSDAKSTAELVAGG